jgi:hypothetical protein
MQTIFINKCFLFTLGSVCRVQGSALVANVSLVTKRLKHGGAELAETTVKIRLCCGFRHTAKAIGQVHQC